MRRNAPVALANGGTRISYWPCLTKSGEQDGFDLCRHER